MYDALFSPLQIGNHTVRNRFCFPSVGLPFDADPRTGGPLENRLQQYEAVAAGGTGLIVVGITAVQKNARLRTGEFGLWTDRQIDLFRPLTEAIHRHGALTTVQLHHAGARVMPEVCRERVAPSPIPGYGARAMTLAEVQRLRDDFIAAARRAQLAGFDGIELHAAHGYLLSLFASPRYNHRADRYGGSLENRVRLQTEILQGARQVCGPDFILASRIGGNEPTYAEGVQIAKLLEQAGADYISVSFGLDDHYDLDTPYWRPTPAPDWFDGNAVTYGASVVRQSVRIPVVALRSICTAKRGEWLLENGHADLIAYARPMLTNPDFVNRIRNGVHPATECLNCDACRWFTNPAACPIERKHGRDIYAALHTARDGT